MSTERQDVIDDCIEALEEALDAHIKSNEAQGLLHAIEVLNSLKSDENGGAA